MKDRPPISSATSNRLAKTPAVTPSRKLLGKVASRTEQQPKRAKPLPPPPSTTTTAVATAVEPLPVHPPARTDDQILDFSLLHTIKNAHGQIKVNASRRNLDFYRSFLFFIVDHDVNTKYFYDRN